MNDQAVINWVKGCFRPKSRASTFVVYNPPTGLEGIPGPTGLERPNQFAYVCDGFSLLRVELNHKLFFGTVALPDPGTEYRWDLGWHGALRDPRKPDRTTTVLADCLLPTLQTRYGDPEALPGVMLVPYLFETDGNLHRIFTALGEPAFCVDKRSLDLLAPTYDELTGSAGPYAFRCGGPITQKPLIALDRAGVALWAMRTDIKEPLHF